MDSTVALVSGLLGIVAVPTIDLIRNKFPNLTDAVVKLIVLIVCLVLAGTIYLINNQTGLQGLLENYAVVLSVSQVFFGIFWKDSKISKKILD